MWPILQKKPMCVSHSFSIKNILRLFIFLWRNTPLEMKCYWMWKMVNCIMFFCCTPDPVKKKTQQNVVGTEIYLVFTNSSTANILITSSNQSLRGALIVLLKECIISISLNSDSHLPKQSVLFTSTKGLQKWWRMLFILS